MIMETRPNYYDPDILGMGANAVPPNERRADIPTDAPYDTLPPEVHYRRPLTATLRLWLYRLLGRLQ